MHARAQSTRASPLRPAHRSKLLKHTVDPRTERKGGRSTNQEGPAAEVRRAKAAFFAACLACSPYSPQFNSHTPIRRRLLFLPFLLPLGFHRAHINRGPLAHQRTEPSRKTPLRPHSQTPAHTCHLLRVLIQDGVPEGRGLSKCPLSPVHMRSKGKRGRERAGGWGHRR